MSTAMDIVERATDFDDVAARDAFIIKECGDDQELLARVRQLLDEHLATIAHDSASNRSHGTTGYSLNQLEAGDSIGPYRLIEKIGEGGMGVVFSADQKEPVRRRVALKIIKPGMDSKEVVQRFEAERRALAMMDHPNIARVLDAGETASGMPFFVMELVAGIPITTFCDQQKLNNLERLAIFTTVCQAIQHAHQKGIIHRDIKPSNILVTLQDDAPSVRVIDFGVAKAINPQLLDSSIFTKMTQLLGTPLYMSPEQADLGGLDIDTRTDIYSLGVLLYELLTGTTPFNRKELSQAAFDEMRRIIQEVTPAKPSERIGTLGDSADSASDVRRSSTRQLSADLKGDLDWIVMKAIEKDRGRRYGTASEFAADVTRYLNHDPVLAGPPSAAYRLRKFVQRNRVGVLAGSLVAMALVAGVIGTTAGMLWAFDQQARADQAADNATAATIAESEARKRAERNAQLARDAVQDMLSAVGDKRLRNVPYMDSLREQLLLDALEFNKIFMAASDDRDDQIEAGQAYRQVADIYYLLERSEDSLESMEQALAIFRSTLSQNPDDLDALYLIADTELQMAHVLNRMSEFEQAREHTNLAIRGFQSHSENFDDNSRFPIGLACGFQMLGILDSGMGNYTQSEAELRSSLETFSKVSSATSNTEACGPLQAKSHIVLSDVLYDTDRPDEGLAQLEESLALYKKLVADHPQERDYREGLAETHTHIGGTLIGMGDLEQARVHLAAGIAIFEPLANDFPQIPDYLVAVANNASGLAVTYAQAFDFENAQRYFELSLSSLEEVNRDFPNIPEFLYEFGHAKRRLGVLYSNLSQPERAIELYQDAFETFTSLAEGEPNKVQHRIDLTILANSLAKAFRRIGNETLAKDWNDQAISTGESLAVELPNVISIRHKLAQFYMLAGQLCEDDDDRDQAEARYNQAIDLHRRLVDESPEYDDHHRFLAIELYELAELYQLNGELDDAESIARESLSIREGRRERNPERAEHAIETSHSLELLNVILRDKMEFEAAQAASDSSADIISGLLLKHPEDLKLQGEYLHYLENRASLFQVQEHWDEALAVCEEFKTKFDEFLTQDPTSARVNERGRSVLGIWATTLAHLKRFDESVEVVQTISEIDARSQASLAAAMETAESVLTLIEAMPEVEPSERQSVIDSLKAEIEKLRE